MHGGKEVGKQGRFSIIQDKKAKNSEWFTLVRDDGIVLCKCWALAEAAWIMGRLAFADDVITMLRDRAHGI
jgi:hypothetical protein